MRTKYFLMVSSQDLLKSGLEPVPQFRVCVEDRETVCPMSAGLTAHLLRADEDICRSFCPGCLHMTDSMGSGDAPAASASLTLSYNIKECHRAE